MLKQKLSQCPLRTPFRSEPPQLKACSDRGFKKQNPNSRSFNSGGSHGFAFILFVLIFFLSPVAKAEDQPLTLDFTDAPVSAILSSIAQLSGHNLVLGGGVQGRMSLHVIKMNWPAALQMVLSSQNLSLKNVDDHTWYIEDTAHLANQVRSENELAKNLDTGLLETEFFHIRYANPQDMLTLIQNNHALLSSRGQASLDLRTSTLIVSDTLVHLDLVRMMLQEVDVPVPQIKINARIVMVNKSALQALGVLLGTNTANTAVMLGSVNAANINLPIDNPAGSIGFSLGKIEGQVLDLQLQALEDLGEGKVISAPELTVLNNQEAYIEQGNEVPFRTSTSSGATQIEFKKAVLGLAVIPQRLEDGSFNLRLKINKDAVTDTEAAKTGTPIISTSEVNTTVRVKEGETLVLGGIYSENKSSEMRQVPGLAGIPGLGWLFKSRQVSDQYTDLLVFITPQLVEAAPAL